MKWVNSMSTRERNMLDLVLCNNKDLIYNIEVAPTGQSDHSVLYITTNLDQNFPNTINSERGRPQLGDINPCKTNWELINEKLLEFDWDEMLQEKNRYQIYNIIMHNLREMLENHGHKRHSVSKTYKTKI